MSLIQDMKKHKNLTEREQDIRKYILEHPEKIEEMSSRELGHATFASAASVTRFCQKLGTKGFPEFKLQLVRELQYETIEEEEVITMSERENVVTMVRKATQVQRQAIEETKKELSYSHLVKIGRMIADASCVDFYVYDMNVYLADYGCSLFFHAGKVANVHSATNIQGLHAAMPADGHVAILISHTGKNERLAEIAGMLRKGGTKVIVISAVRDQDQGSLQQTCCCKNVYEWCKYCRHRCDNTVNNVLLRLFDFLCRCIQMQGFCNRIIDFSNMSSDYNLELSVIFHNRDNSCQCRYFFFYSFRRLF